MKTLNFGRGAAALLLSAFVLASTGCVTATVQEVREASTELNDGESVVVLSRRARPNPTETENNFVGCVSSKMAGGSNRVAVVKEDQFRDALFPWFEPRTAPTASNDLPELISQPALAARLEEIGLKYVVWIEGSTRRTDAAGSLTCNLAATGVACFGFLTWENDSDYEAQVWDVREGKAVGRVSSEAIGTSYMPAVIVPVPLIARVQNSACSTLATQLKGFLTNKS